MCGLINTEPDGRIVMASQKSDRGKSRTHRKSQEQNPMRTTAWVNHSRIRPRIVGVIASKTALVRATRLRCQPDFFELRLDALRNSLGEIEEAILRLHAPLILTARHPAEGGQGSLGTMQRTRLIERFLDRAALVDLELRSVRHFSSLLQKMQRRAIGLLLSMHEFRKSPQPNKLAHLTNLAAKYHPAFFKVVVCTNTPEQLDRITHFFEEARSLPFPIAAMGIGKFGHQSRRDLMHLGSALNYGFIGDPMAEGQPTLAQLQRDRRAYICGREIRDA